MTPYVTITKDNQNHLTKNVLNDDGTVREEWLENGSDVLEKVRSYTYYTTPNSHKGLTETETVYNVATSGENRDMLTTYTYTFDTTGQTVTATTGGKSTVSHYNKLGQLDWDMDEQGRQTDYEYDYQGRQTQTIYPLVTGDSARKTSISNYNCCHLEFTVDEKSHYTYYGYDGKGRMNKTWTQITGQSEESPLVEYVFDDTNFGLQSQIKTRSEAGVERIISYDYNGLGQIKKIVYPYTTEEGDLIGSEEYLYDKFGRLVIKKDGNGKMTAYEYDELNRITGIDYDYSGNFELSLTNFTADVAYTYDGPTSRISTVTEDIGGTIMIASYAYDDRGRLISYSPNIQTSGRFVGYGAITYTWNNLNQKTSMTVPIGSGQGRKIIYNYDNTGKMIDMDVKPVAVATNAYPTAPPADNKTHFYYDSNGNRVQMLTKAGHRYYYVYDPTASIPAVVFEMGPQKRYLNIREPDGSLVARETYDGYGIRKMSRTYHFDGLGSTIALSDENGNITDEYKYDAWGKVTSHTGTTTDNPYQYVGQYGYYTHYQEPTFGLLQLGVRYYDPTVGRFTQVDPAKDGVNWYTYAYNRPMYAIDPNGDLIGIIVAGGVLIVGAAVYALPDWGTDALTERQGEKVACHISLLRKCAREQKLSTLDSYLSQLNITGIFERKDPESDDQSESRGATLGGLLRKERTILSADYFDRDLFGQLNTLLHESYHVGRNHWTDKDNKAYDWAAKYIKLLSKCIEKKIKCKAYSKCK